jgi:hypothetical protein
MSGTQRSKQFEEYIEAWIYSENKLIDPKTKEHIEPSLYYKSKYVQLYKKAFHYLKNTKQMPTNSIKTLLPKHHILFGNIDILYCRSLSTKEKNIYMTKAFDSEAIKLYTFIYENLGKHNNDNIDIESIELFQIDGMNKNEKIVLHYLVYHYAATIQKYIELASKIFSISYLEFHKYVKLIKYQIDIVDLVEYSMMEYKLQDIFIKAFQDENSYGCQLIKEISCTNCLFGYDLVMPHIIHNKMNNSNLYSYLKELLYIYDYKNFYSTPFQNLANKKFEEIEDPLEVIIMKKIGVKNIDLKTLESPKRIFKNDKEYETYVYKYKTLQDDYESEYQTWRKVNKLDEKQSPNTQSVTTTPPKRPVLTLPNKSMVTVLRKEQSSALPQSLSSYIPDEKYTKIRETIADNKKVMDMYRELIDVGLLKLTNNHKKYNLELLDKDRAYFENNVLDNDNVRNANRCVANHDNLTKEDFDHPDYLLAKLQLMFKLHKRDENGKVVFTYCFYAPAFYNYLVNQINSNIVIKHPVTNQMTIKNPITKEPVDDEDIQQLMQIMKVIDSSIERPVYMKPIHDINLVMNYSEFEHNGNQFFKVLIQRRIGDVMITVHQLCTILADVDARESHSSDITSDIFIDIVFDLFYNGRLLKNYMPPYKDQNNEFIKPMIHFNRYKTPEQWGKPTREEQLEMFVHYLDEIRLI